MAVFKNVSALLVGIGSAGQTARFSDIGLPAGFNEWTKAVAELKQDNPEFFESFGDPEPGKDVVGAIFVNGHRLAYMLHTGQGRFVVTDMTKILSRDSFAPNPGALRDAIHMGRLKLGREGR